MPFDGAFGDHEYDGDLAVRFAFRDQLRDIALTASQIARLVRNMARMEAEGLKAVRMPEVVCA